MNVQKICAHAALSLALVSSATSHGMEYKQQAALVIASVSVGYLAYRGIACIMHAEQSKVNRAQLKANIARDHPIITCDERITAYNALAKWLCYEGEPRNIKICLEKVIPRDGLKQIRYGINKITCAELVQDDSLE